ncbi:MAG: tRNA lysidine(34) synthetase TilS [Verrucomicrobiota bacterium]
MFKQNQNQASVLQDSVLATLSAFDQKYAQGKWGVAVSGGVDSMVLLEGMRRASLSFIVCHLDHGWRDSSAADAAWLEKWCLENKIPFRLKQVAGMKKSEDSARQARLSFYEEVIKQEELSGVWLAQHADDVIETFFLQLLRGAGPEGLASIQPVSQVHGISLYRPLLNYSKEQLLQLANDWELDWREDETNQSMEFARNRVRHLLLPVLRKCSEREFTPLLTRTIQLLSAENDDWLARLPNSYPEKIPVSELKDETVAWQRRYLKGWLQSLRVKDISFEDVEAVRGLLSGGSPAKVNLSEARYARRTAGYLYLD